MTMRIGDMPHLRAVAKDMLASWPRCSCRNECDCHDPLMIIEDGRAHCGGQVCSLTPFFDTGGLLVAA